MGTTESLEETIEREHIDNTQVKLDTSIADFIEIILKDKKNSEKKYLTQGFYFSLKQVSRYIDTIGDLKMLAKNAGGFTRLKGGVTYNNERERKIPYDAMRLFGKKKLEYLNEVLFEYGIKPIPWMTKKYRSGERQKEKGWDWWNRTIEI